MSLASFGALLKRSSRSSRRSSRRLYRNDSLTKQPHMHFHKQGSSLRLDFSAILFGEGATSPVLQEIDGYCSILVYCPSFRTQIYELQAESDTLSALAVPNPDTSHHASLTSEEILYYVSLEERTSEGHGVIQIESPAVYIIFTFISDQLSYTMSQLSSKLAALEAAGTPIQVGLIGAGKFGSMFISQSHRTPGIRLAAIADLDPQRALASLKRTGYPANRYDETASISIAEGIEIGKTAITSDSGAMIASPGIDVVLEVTGSPAAGVSHALLCCEHKKHIVMVNVEADVLAGPLLARRAAEAGIIYSMAYGDQPALIAELVDWARAAGFNVVCAGKGTKHLPEYHYSTPDTVWNYYGFTEEQLRTGDFNKQMFNSFLDGTKSALEAAAVANGADLAAPSNGLKFPPCGVHDLPTVLRPREKGGQLEESGTVEVVSCLETDGRNVFGDLRWGVYVIIEAPGEYQRDCFAQYGLKTDPSGWYAAQYKPYHLIGLELGISIANIMCRGEATGQTRCWRGDVVATAKRDLKAGEKLDGEGGFMVYGKLMPAESSLQIEGLPIGLAHGLTLRRGVLKDKGLSWQDVEFDETKNQAVAVRKEMEDIFRKEFGIARVVNGTHP